MGKLKTAMTASPMVLLRSPSCSQIAPAHLVGTHHLGEHQFADGAGIGVHLARTNADSTKRHRKHTAQRHRQVHLLSAPHANLRLVQSHEHDSWRRAWALAGSSLPGFSYRRRANAARAHD